MAVRSKFLLKGDRAAIASLKRKSGAVFQRVKAVQNSTARDIIQESNRIVPKDKFELVRSARIQEDSGRRSIRTLGITYDTEYAVAVHEDLQAKHAPGTQAKFLEGPAKKQRRRYASELKAAMVGGLS